MYNQYMAHNFTPIDDLVKKHKEMSLGVSSVAKEVMPMRQTEHIDREQTPEQNENVQQAPIHHFVVKRQETIQLPTELKEFGLEAVNNEELSTVNNIKLPISDEQIMQDLKAPPSESKRWYATFFLYLLERAHLTLRKVGDKVVRVIKLS